MDNKNYQKNCLIKRSKAFLAILLTFAMVFNLSACGKSGSSMSGKLLTEGVLNEENLVLENSGVKLELDPVLATSDFNASISKVSNAPSLDEEGEINLEVYDFKLEGVSKVEGVILLTIPLELTDGQVPGAAYLNEETSKWEPVAFKYDEATSSVVIMTDHLSKYGVFYATGEGRRNARIEFLGLFGENQDEDFLAAIEEYSLGGVPSSKCLEIGIGAAGDSLQIGSDVLGNMVQSAGYLAYGDDVVSTIGDHLGSIGLLISVVQIGSNLYEGKIHDALVASMKTSYSYMMGKLVSKLSNSVLSASMAAVAIVDYSINKFGTEAIEGRADIYRDAYSIYYLKGEDGYKGSDYWYKTFYPIFSNPKMTEDALKAEIDKIVTNHCKEFWTGTNRLGVDYYVSEAREKMAWTGGGAGLNDELRNKISQERRAMLYNDVLPGVFRQITLKINMDNEARLRNEYKALSDYLNKPISFSVIDPSKKLSRHQVRFSNLNDKADVSNWTGKFRDDGSINTSFTLYGHMYAGSPTKLDVYASDADIDQDEPVDSIEFKVTPPSIEIVLEDDDKFDTLVMARSSDEIISSLLQHDEYKSYYSETVFPTPLEHLLSQNPLKISEDNKISVNLSGSWAADTISGGNELVDAWSTYYKYDIHDLSFDINLSKNEEVPVIGTDKKALYLEGTGTYNYSVTVTKITTVSQETMGLFERAWIDGNETRTTKFSSRGEVVLYYTSKAIDSSKPVIQYDHGIDNIETTGIILEFKNPTNTYSGVADHYLKTRWEDKTEKEETSSDTYTTDASLLLMNGDRIYFKYPAK